MNLPPVPRREFLKNASLAAAALAVSHGTGAEATKAATAAPDGKGGPGKLRIAFVGVGGRGGASVQALATEHHVAFCDVDDARAAGTYKKYPDVPRFRDYRQMLDKVSKPTAMMVNRIINDRVTISAKPGRSVGFVPFKAGNKWVFMKRAVGHAAILDRYIVFSGRIAKFHPPMG